MISDFDDYPIHQTSDPVNQPGSSDRNFYDRYWFNGFDRDAAFAFEVGFGLYPNRFVMDGHLSVVFDGVQHSFHASRRAPIERSECEIGPLLIEVEQPMRSVRVRLGPNETGIECDLVFSARSFPTLEPKSRLFEGPRLIMETSRFTQFGRWSGQIVANGRLIAVDGARTLGTRDRSWGVRPVGEPPGGAPAPHPNEPGVYWIWAPIHFDDMYTQCGSFEDRDGHPTQLSAAIVPAYASSEEVSRHEEPGHREMATMRHRIRWEPGTRRSRSAELELVARDGGTCRIELEPLLRFQMLGIGYQHPEWGHGRWHGELVTASESWKLDELDPLDYKHIHVHQICRARMSGALGERVGIGTLETVVFGRHAPSGFASLLDGAA